MFKQRLILVLAGLALLLVTSGASGVVAQKFGISLVPQVLACQNSSSSGGGC